VCLIYVLYVPNLSVRVCVCMVILKGCMCVYLHACVFVCVCVSFLCVIGWQKKLKERWKKKKKKEERGKRRNKGKEQETSVDNWIV